VSGANTLAKLGTLSVIASRVTGCQSDSIKARNALHGGPMDSIPLKSFTASRVDRRLKKGDTPSPGE
jgi:hypothetical protein